MNSGDRYEGDWKDGQQHGHGKFFFASSGGEYEGQWVHDKRQGQGIMLFGDSGMYDGEWKDNHQHGHGTFTDGDYKYVGSWVDGKQHGRGSLTADGGIFEYEGEWQNGQMHGHGQLIRKSKKENDAWIDELRKMEDLIKNNDEDDGDWLDTGIQEHVEEGEDIYEGSFVEGIRQGYGKLTLQNGDIYDGFWENDCLHGQGKYTFAATGSEYDGHWVDSMRDGLGIMSYGDGGVYEGTWESNKMQGRGTFVDETGVYEGDWVEGQQHGWGKYVYHNGDIYDGEWNFGKKHGNGTFVVRSSGDVYHGTWEHDKIVSHSKSHDSEFESYIFNETLSVEEKSTIITPEEDERIGGHSIRNSSLGGEIGIDINLNDAEGDTVEESNTEGGQAQILCVRSSTSYEADEMQCGGSRIERKYGTDNIVRSLTGNKEIASINTVHNVTEEKCENSETGLELASDEGTWSTTFEKEIAGDDNMKDINEPAEKYEDHKCELVHTSDDGVCNSTRERYVIDNGSSRDDVKRNGDSEVSDDTAWNSTFAKEIIGVDSLSENEKEEETHEDSVTQQVQESDDGNLASTFDDKHLGNDVPCVVEVKRNEESNEPEEYESQNNLWDSTFEMLFS